MPCCTCWTRYMSFMNVLIRKMMYQNTQTGNAQHQNVLFIIEIYIILTYKAFYPTYDREFYRTIRSGFYDVDHICYASKCNYFVTCDYALSSQAMEIYRYLGCKTNVIYCEKKAPAPSLPLAVLCKKTATP